MTQLYHQIIHYVLERAYYKMGISEKLKTINNKIEQNKAPCSFDGQATGISALQSGNVS